MVVSALALTPYTVNNKVFAPLSKIVFGCWSIFSVNNSEYHGDKKVVIESPGMKKQSKNHMKFSYENVQTVYKNILKSYKSI